MNIIEKKGRIVRIRPETKVEVVKRKATSLNTYLIILVIIETIALGALLYAKLLDF